MDFPPLLTSHYIEVAQEGASKVESVLQPCSTPLVPSICSTIFAKRSCRFWAQELENVRLFVQCLQSQTFSFFSLSKITERKSHTYSDALWTDFQNIVQIL